MEIKTFTGGADKNFSYLVLETAAGGSAFLVDASVEPAPIFEELEKVGAKVEYLFITHGHADHLTFVRPILQETGATLVAFNTDLSLEGFPFHPAVDGAEFTVGGLSTHVLHTPGHAADHIVVLAGSALFTGDLLFIGRTGRTIMPGADTPTLYRSISRKIAPLSRDTTIYPGHDYGKAPTDTLARQKETNPFLGAASEEEFIEVMKQYEASRR